MLDEFLVAKSSDLDAVCEFYQAVCDQQSAADYAPGWDWGDYPNRNQLAQAIDRGQVLIGYAQGRLAAAGVLTHGEDAGYADVTWQKQFPDDQIGVLHLYAVHPDYRGQGIASGMLQGILEQARQDGLKVVHLDVRKGNVPAERLYT